MEQNTTTKCHYPDWEGGIVLDKHTFGKDGFCGVCGALRRKHTTVQQAVSEMLNEDGYVDTLYLGC